MQAYYILIKEKELHQVMYYKNEPILSYTIKYPQFISFKFQTVLNKINAFYKTKALMYEKTNMLNLYQMAMVDYENAKANDYPVRPYEAYTDYKVTYNENCTLSLYFDQYEYTGGAHGITIQSSDTWDLQKSRRMELKEFFTDVKYKEFIIDTIIKEIDSKKGTEDFMYFDDYEKLVHENFNINSFYLDEVGIVLYFQSYDIAPYASGLPTFTIPYTTKGVIPPKCN